MDNLRNKLSRRRMARYGLTCRMRSRQERPGHATRQRRVLRPAAHAPKPHARTPSCPWNRRIHVCREARPGSQHQGNRPNSFGACGNTGSTAGHDLKMIYRKTLGTLDGNADERQGQFRVEILTCAWKISRLASAQNTVGHLVLLFRGSLARSATTRYLLEKVM